MKVKIRYILIVLLFFLLLASFAYKYFEWVTLRNLVANYNAKVVQELTLVEQNDKTNDEVADLYTETITNEQLSDEEYLQKLGELQGKTRLVINGDEHYIQILTKNKEFYENLLSKTKFLLGKRGNFIKVFLYNQIKYYENELEAANRGLISDYLSLDIFTVMRDRAIMTNYQNKVSDNPERDIPYYYSEIAVLEKYTKSDFAFEKAGDVRKLYPYGYEALNRNRDYMGSYYSIIKDFVAGDYDSATYKLSRLNEAELNLNIDFERLFDEGKNENIELAKKIFEADTAKMLEIKRFKEMSLGIYPLLEEVKGWKEDLEMCQLYNYKFSLINAISGSYPKASSVDELILEMSRVAPKSNEIDKSFNKDTIQFSNTDEEAKFVCKDIEENREFIFLIKK